MKQPLTIHSVADHRMYCSHDSLPSRPCIVIAMRESANIPTMMADRISVLITIPLTGSSRKRIIHALSYSKMKHKKKTGTMITCSNIEVTDSTEAGIFVIFLSLFVM